jgi:hypothetical protein
MKKTVWTRSFDYSGNLKSKTCPEISRRSENLKQIGLAVIALVIVVTGTVAQAQTPKRIPRIGYLGGGSAELEKGWLDAFLQGLRELG